MKTTWLGLLLVPCLLAPVYYQGQAGKPLGDDTAPAANGLPAAEPLQSPLLVTPTFDVSAGVAAGVAVSPSKAGNGEPEAPDEARQVANPVACAQGLGVMQDMAALAYQTNPAQTYMGVMVAAALARQQVLAEDVPNLATLRKRLKAIRYGGTLRDQLLQAYVLLEVPCAPVKGAGKVVATPVISWPK